MPRLDGLDVLAMLLFLPAPFSGSSLCLAAGVLPSSRGGWCLLTSLGCSRLTDMESINQSINLKKRIGLHSKVELAIGVCPEAAGAARVGSRAKGLVHWVFCSS